LGSCAWGNKGENYDSSYASSCGTFAQFKSEKKQIELRINDPKRKTVKIDDKVVFTSRESGEELAFKVVGCVLFRDFRMLVTYMASA